MEHVSKDGIKALMNRKNEPTESIDDGGKMPRRHCRIGRLGPAYGEVCQPCPASRNFHETSHSSREHSPLRRFRLDNDEEKTTGIT